MFKREMKINLKSFMIWTSILVGLMLIVFLIYPSIMNAANTKMIEDMMKMFPEEMIKAFNMDISNVSTVFGWLKSEGFIFILLITGIYSAILGSNILLKEENDKTIEYLNNLPITRSKIIIDKTLSAIFYIVLMIIVIGIFNFVGLNLSGDFDKKTYILLSIVPLFSSITLFSICFFISTFTHKTKKTIGISLGIVFISYFLNIVSEMSKNVEFLKYLSVFTLSDVRNVILNISINPIIMIISITISFLLITLTFINYNKKDLI